MTMKTEMRDSNQAQRSGTVSTTCNSETGRQTAASDTKKLQRILATLLLPGESKSHYDELRRLIFETLDPRDTIETLWAKDITDAAFDSERMKRLKMRYIDSIRIRCLKAAISKIVAPDPLQNLSSSQVAERFVNEALQEANGEPRIRHKLSHAGVEPEALIAEAYGRQLDEIDKFERLIIGAERKRDRLIRQLYEFRNYPPRGRASVLDLKARAVHTRSGSGADAEH